MKFDPNDETKVPEAPIEAATAEANDEQEIEDEQEQGGEA